MARRRPLRRAPRSTDSRFPAPDGFGQATLTTPGAHWDADLGEYLLDWDEVRSASEPRNTALDFCLEVVRHACSVCGWDPALAASAEGVPPPVN